MKALIVGGSLAGLSTAIALNEVGVEVELWEKKARMPDTAGGIGAQTIQATDNAIAKKLKHLIQTEADPARAFYGHVFRRWEDIYKTYRSYLEEETDVVLHFDCRVMAAGQTPAGVYLEVGTECITGDLLIGPMGIGRLFGLWQIQINLLRRMRVISIGAARCWKLICQLLRRA